MAALLSCVGRHRARLFRTSQSTHVHFTTRTCAALYSVAPRHPPVLSRALPRAASLRDVFGKPFSFSTTATDPGTKKKKSSGRPSRTRRNARGDRAATDPRHPLGGLATTQSTVAIDRSKNEWMKRSAGKGDYAAVLHAVFDCYKPLYATHPLLIGKESSLLTAASGEAATPGKTPFQPVEYDDVETQLTEKVALTLFRPHGQLELALVVLNHREWIASTVGNAPLANGTHMDFGRRTPAFLYEAMRTHYSLRDYAQAERIYDQAIHQGVSPTSNMTCAYIDTLVNSKKFAKALVVWGQVQHQKRSVGKHTLQSMLYMAGTTHNPELTMEVLDLVKSKGYELHGKSYLHAMRSFDREYYLTAQDKDDSSSKGRAARSLYTEDYYHCTQRITEQATNPDKYASIEAASTQVLKLFDELVQTTTASYPQEIEKMLPRVMTAAMFLGEYNTIAAYTARYHDVIAKELDPIAIRIATNALLVQHQPVAAWELVLEMYGKLWDDPSACSFSSSRPETKVGVNTLGNVVQYLRINKQARNVKKLLAVLADQGRLSSALSAYSSMEVMRTVMLQTADTSNDDDLWQLVVVDYAQVFPVLVDAKVWMDFVKACARAGHWSLVVKAIQSRDKTQLPDIVPLLASFAENQVLTSETPYFAYLKLLAKLPDLVVESGEDSMSEADKITLACNAIYALEVLQQQKQQQTQHQRAHRDWMLEIVRLHAQYLSGAADAIPTKVQEIVKRAQE